MTGGSRRSAAVARWRGLSENARGILWMLIAVVMFALMTALIKDVATVYGYNPFQLAFFRSFFAFCSIAPFALVQARTALHTAHPFMHWWRGSVGVIAMFAGYYSVKHLPLALSTSISFASPLFVVVLAVLFLGETVRWRRWLATILGFVGVLVMVRPTQGIDPAALFGLLGAAMSAFSIVLTKRMPVSERPITILFWSNLTASLTTLAFALPGWQMPGLPDLGLLILVGMFGGAGQSCMVHAYRIAEASVVGPIDYVRLLFATVIGLLWFGEWPDTWTVVGAAIIVASTAYIARREATLRRNIPRAAAVN